MNNNEPELNGEELAIKKQKEKEALEEFEKLPKQLINISIGVGKIISGVPAVIYKGFAIHEPIGAVNPNGSIYKTITIIKGKARGQKLLDCNVTEYKKCIDEIRAVIGDKTLDEMNDLKLIKPIVDKY